MKRTKRKTLVPGYFNSFIMKDKTNFKHLQMIKLLRENKHLRKSLPSESSSNKSQELRTDTKGTENEDNKTKGYESLTTSIRAKKVNKRNYNMDILKLSNAQKNISPSRSQRSQTQTISALLPSQVQRNMPIEYVNKT